MDQYTTMVKVHIKGYATFYTTSYSLAFKIMNDLALWDYDDIVIKRVT